jgi:hypothetical protein
VFEPSPDFIAEAASWQRLRLRLGQLVETAVLWKVKEEARICKKCACAVDCTSAADECGAAPFEGDVQKSKILKNRRGI